ncbi:MAG: RNA polymerase sigma factor [Planctomycetota bacterium]|nr:RNA polymerase sigma factor [Planctomycetota bacterium]
MSDAPAAEALDRDVWDWLDPVPGAPRGPALAAALAEEPSARRLVELALEHVLIREVAQEEAARKLSPRESQRLAKIAGPNDEELVLQVEQGIPGAFDALMERYFNLAVGVAYSLLGDAEAAKDVAQDAFLEAAKMLHTLRERNKFGNWVYGITRRRAIYVLRRRKMHRAAIEVKKDEEKAAPVPDDPGTPLDKRERSQHIRDALGQIPEIYREVLVLKYMDGRSYEEIAALLGISLAAIDKRLMRGKAMLRDSLRKFIDE